MTIKSYSERIDMTVDANIVGREEENCEKEYSVVKSGFEVC
jgi:hypothetical protein